MKGRFGFVGMLALAAGIALVPVARQASGFTLVERGGQGTLLFRTIIAIDQAMMCDGSHRLPAGRYDVEVFSFADGSVRARFLQGNTEQCTAVGRLQRGKPSVNAQQVAFEREGQREVLQIGSPGMDQVLIGLLLPAVQKGMGDGSIHPGGAGALLPAVQAPGAKGSTAAAKMTGSGTPH